MGKCGGDGAASRCQIAIMWVLLLQSLLMHTLPPPLSSLQPPLRLHAGELLRPARVLLLRVVVRCLLIMVGCRRSLRLSAVLCLQLRRSPPTNHQSRCASCLPLPSPPLPLLPHRTGVHQRAGCGSQAAGGVQEARGEVGGPILQ